jgi:hypothetical protein
MSKKSQAPSFEDLITVSRWARVVVLARAMRRLQPLFAEVWPEAPKWCAGAIERSIATGETAAAQGSKTADINAAATGAMKVFGSMPDKVLFSDRGFARQIGYAASRVSYAGSETEPWFAMEGMQDAIRIAEDFAALRKNPKLAKPFVALLLREYKQLKTASQAGRWNAKTPVDATQLGELWPDGVPEGWPAPQQHKSRPKKAKAIDLAALHVPRDLIAFLKAGNKLKYRAAKTEVGPIKLKPLDHLQLSVFGVAKSTTSSAKVRVQGVDLVDECDSYTPEGILIWLPDYKCFGQHDPDHAQMVIFPRTKWADIVSSPAKYLNAQWKGFKGFGEYVVSGNRRG